MQKLMFFMLLVWSGTSFAEGTVLNGTFASQALGVTKAYRDYLPEGYSTSAARYPVIYMLHGLGVTETAWTIPSLNVAAAADEMNSRTIIEIHSHL